MCGCSDDNWAILHVRLVCKMSWALCFHKSNLLIEQQYSLGSTLSFIVPVNVECDMAVALSDFSDILLSITTYKL